MDSRERTTETERRRGTVLFIDITGFTALNQELGAEATYSVITPLLKLLDDRVRHHGGHVDKYLGDCVMATFGVPFAMENAPRAAVNAAIDMHIRVEKYNRDKGIVPALGVHTGIESGLMISGDVSGPVVREFSVMGDCVNIAARLKDLAPTGSIWIGQESERSVRESFELRSVGTLELKGIREPHSSYEVVSRDVQRHRERSHERTQIHSPLVGRANELAQLRGLLRQLGEGHGGIVALVSDAGGGKSRLAAELANVGEAAEIRWIEAPSLDVGVKRGFYPFVELLRSWLNAEDADDSATREALQRELSALFPEREEEILPLLANLMGLPLHRREQKHIAAIEGDAMEKMILRALGELFPLIAADAPLVLYFEDFHWADASSTHLLEPLLRLAENHPILFLLSTRPGFASAAEFLDRSRAEHTERYQEIHLDPLDRGASEELLENIFANGNVSVAMRSVIEERTAGNPFFIEEVVRSLIDQGAVEWKEGALFSTERIDEVEIPGSVQEVIMTRIDQLPMFAKHVLGVASVIGLSSDPAVLEGVVNDEAFETQLDLLITSQLLVRRRRRSSVEIQFCHPLIQAVTYDHLLEAKRKELHLEVAEAIEDSLPETTPGQAGMLAYHFGLGEDPRAEPYLLRAGDEAARVAASSEALYFFREASKLYVARFGETADPETLASLEKKIALAYLNRGQFIDAMGHFDKALELLGVDESRGKLAGAFYFARSFVTVFSGIYLPGLQRSRVAASDRQQEVFDLRIDRARVQVTADPSRFLADCLAHFHDFRRVDHSSIQRLGWLYAAFGGLLSYAGILFSVSARFLKKAREVIDTEDERELFFLGLMSFTHGLLSGDWDGEHEVDPALVALALQHGQLWDVTTYVGLEENKLVHQGRFQDAAADLELLMKIQDLYDYDYARSTTLFSTTILRLEQGHFDQALRASEEYVSQFDEPALNILALGTRAEVQMAMADLEGAHDSLDRADAILQNAGTVPPFQSNSTLRARFALDVRELQIAVRDGSSAEVRALKRRVRHSGRRARRVASRMAWDKARIFRTSGRAFWIQGNHRKALRWWNKAAHAAQELAMKPELARTYRDIGEHLNLARGGPSEFEGQSGDAWLSRADELRREIML